MDRTWLVVKHDKDTNDEYMAFGHWGDAWNQCVKLADVYPDSYTFVPGKQFGEECLYCSEDYYIAVYNILFVGNDITGMGQAWTVEDCQPFPIQGQNIRDEHGYLKYQPKCYIPRWLAEEAYRWYSKLFGENQSIERIAERGGFGRDELLKLLRRE